MKRSMDVNSKKLNNKTSEFIQRSGLKGESP